MENSITLILLHGHALDLRAFTAFPNQLLSPLGSRELALFTNLSKALLHRQLDHKVPFVRFLLAGTRSFL